MWFAVAVMQLLITGFIALAIHLVLGSRWSWSFIFASAIWITALGFMGVADAFTINVDKFFGAVLSNALINYEPPVDDQDALEINPTRKLEEVGPGLHPRWPWQKPYFYDLRRQITVPMPVKAYTSDGLETNLQSSMVVSAIRGYLCNLHRNSEVEAQEILKNFAVSQLAAHVNKMTQPDVIRDQDEIRKWFAKEVFKGDDKVSDIERDCGLTAQQLSITQITHSVAYQRSIETKEIAKNTKEAIAQILSADPDNKIGGKEALDAVLATDGNADVRIIRISGLEGLRHVGGAFMLGGDGGGKNKKKKED
jgi:hypothetical protein